MCTIEKLIDKHESKKVNHKKPMCHAKKILVVSNAVHKYPFFLLLGHIVCEHVTCCDQ
jgi:hypothetical protein